VRGFFVLALVTGGNQYLAPAGPCSTWRVGRNSLALLSSLERARKLWSSRSSLRSSQTMLKVNSTSARQPGQRKTFAPVLNMQWRKERDACTGTQHREKASALSTTFIRGNPDSSEVTTENSIRNSPVRSWDQVSEMFGTGHHLG